ncbi:uncharacterized protein LOC142326613 [Lycorma delicatula]|uniref:uncharacterized protein LOC142326613 n=1 Tax=Lycorma delicatula TaxID=130591 RepID=UPI003F50EA73
MKKAYSKINVHKSIFLLLLILYDCETMCYKEFLQSPFQEIPEETCINSQPDCVTEDLSLNVTNDLVGKLQVTFNIDGILNYSQLKVTLKVDENLDGSNCSSDFFEMPSGGLIGDHSMKTIIIKNCSTWYGMDSICNNVISVNFNYIYTGCYKVSVSRLAAGTGYEIRRITRKDPQMVYTKYIKNPLTDMYVSVSPEYFDSMYTFTFIANYSHALNLKYKPVTEELKPKALQLGAIRINDDINSPLNVVNLYKGSEIKAENSSEEFNCSWVEQNEMFDYKILCEGYYLKPGNYCIFIKYYDDRCIKNSIWTERTSMSYTVSCMWSKTIVIEEGNFSKNVITTPLADNEINNSVNGRLIFIIIGIITAIIFILIVKRHTKFSKKIHDFYSNEEEINFNLGQPNVLLLYPRDCLFLMDVMIHFGKVLTWANCKVFDCWDPAQYNSVVGEPNQWVHTLLKNESIEVIVVANECSQLIEKKILNEVYVEYKIPQCFDNIYLYAVHCINQSIVTTSHQKIHVISLSQISEGDKDIVLELINPLQRYCLPIHLEQLILTLHKCQNPRVTLNLDNSCEIKRFKYFNEKYRIYVKDNPNYLNSIFYIRDITKVTKI